jgi:ABC-type uncharacterized transport system permease subunit
MSLFWLGVLIGGFVGACIGLLMAALCASAGGD